MADIHQFLSQNFGHAGTLALIFGSIYGSFVLFDKNLSPRAKHDYTNILKERKYEVLIASLPSILNTIFVNFFGPHHFSFKCLRRSICVSLVSIATALIFTAVIKGLSRSLNFVFMKTDSEWLNFYEVYGKFWVVFVSFIFYMPFADYINLWKTRTLINLFRRYSTSSFVIAVALCDLVIWYIIFTLSTIAFGAIPHLRTDLNDAYIDRLETGIEGWDIWGSGLSSWGIEDRTYIFRFFPFANYFWAGMVPALWLWLNVVAATISIVFAKRSRFLGLRIPMMSAGHSD
jgi:hypothetical protein